MNVTALTIAQRFVGLTESAGVVNNYAIMAMLQLDVQWPSSDEVPWCSAFINYVAWLLGLPRTRSLAAISWLAVGSKIELADAKPGWDVVVLSRPGGNHVGFFVALAGDHVVLLGGNQSNSVGVGSYPVAHVEGVRRLYNDN